MDSPGPGRPQVVVPPGSLWQPAEFTWRIQPVSRSSAVGGRRTGRVCAPGPTAPPGISIVLSPARPIRTPCTRGVQGMRKGCSRLRRLYTPRASGVLPLYTALIAKAEAESGALQRGPIEAAERRLSGPAAGPKGRAEPHHGPIHCPVW